MEIDQVALGHNYLIDVLNDNYCKGLDEPQHYAQLCTIDFSKAFDQVNPIISIGFFLKMYLRVRKNVVLVICGVVAFV